MLRRPTRIIALSLLAGLAGCYSDRPHEYGRQRPPVDHIDDRDRGLQSKDVVSASDKMAEDLLANPDLNRAHDRWAMVVDRVENNTSDRRANLDIFLDRLRVKLATLGHDRIALIENKARYHGLQSNELEGEREGGDPYGQGGSKGGVVKPTYRGTQPDYSLYAKMDDMPNRATNYYYCTFSITDLRTREVVWTNAYEVKVER